MFISILYNHKVYGSVKIKESSFDIKDDTTIADLFAFVMNDEKYWMPTVRSALRLSSPADIPWADIVFAARVDDPASPTYTVGANNKGITVGSYFEMNNYALLQPLLRATSNFNHLRP